MPTSNLYATQPFPGPGANAGADDRRGSWPAGGAWPATARPRTEESAIGTEPAVPPGAPDAPAAIHDGVSGGVTGAPSVNSVTGASGINDGVTEREAALRALRSLEATEARLARNAAREADEARGKLVQELLPVLDNLDRTIAAGAAPDHRGDPAMLEGVRMVRQQLEGVLRGYGVERVEAVGQRFDPSLHEAIGLTQVGDPARHGVVVHQAEPGYRFAGRLLRPAKVSVGKLAAPAYAPQRPIWR
ncbi:MAG TPA: nucleotide exchange factor GrpE [Kofleriaceae bacterium]|jgi:molecular chaperone GrpE (heat shock protein)|nr:nucleotide exchange factor GrpE [Kofleriaceae bacterium]